MEKCFHADWHGRDFSSDGGFCSTSSFLLRMFVTRGGGGSKPYHSDSVSSFQNLSAEG